MEKKFEDLTESEKIVRVLIFAIETKDLQHKDHPTPLGNSYLQHKLNDAKNFCIANGIPLVKIDKTQYHG